MPKDDKNELFYWVNENDKELGSISRQEAHSGVKKIHRSVYILLVNDQDQILLQKRSQQKDTYPGFWTVSTSGHVTYGQTYEEAVKKEMEEEIGISPENFTYISNMFYESAQEKEISKIYLAENQGEEVSIDKTEVEETRWVSIKKLKEFDKNNNLTPAGKKALQTVGWY
ncbi:NUDIX domain-containing protein [Patescibacteria group bacterium]